METHIKRTALNISTYCNLKCKHCLAFIPYYKEKTMMSKEQAAAVLDIYFKVVDTVEHFTVTGGEPLLNKDLCYILEEVYSFQKQITGSVDFVTNGTMEIPDDVLRVFEENREKTKVVLSDYGAELSTRIASIEAELKNYQNQEN